MKSFKDRSLYAVRSYLHYSLICKYHGPSKYEHSKTKINKRSYATIVQTHWDLQWVHL